MTNIKSMLYVAACSATADDPNEAGEKACDEANLYLKDYIEEAQEQHRQVEFEVVPSMVMTSTVGPDAAIYHHYCYTITIIATEKNHHDSSL